MVSDAPMLTKCQSRHHNIFVGTLWVQGHSYSCQPGGYWRDCNHIAGYHHRRPGAVDCQQKQISRPDPVPHVFFMPTRCCLPRFWAIKRTASNGLHAGLAYRGDGRYRRWLSGYFRF